MSPELAAALARDVSSRGAGARAWVAWFVAGAAGAFGWTLLRAGIPEAVALPACAMRELFHIGCATCGLTRALVSLAQGDVGASLTLHPLALPLTIGAALAWLLWGGGLWRGRWLMNRRQVVRAAWLAAAAVLAVWLVRLAAGTVPI